MEPKSIKKSIEKLIDFWKAFGRALGRQMEATGPLNPPVPGPRGGPILTWGVNPSPLWSDPEKSADSLQNGLEMRVVFLKCFGRVLGSPGRPFWLHFSWKEPSKNQWVFWYMFSLILASIWGPKCLPKTLKNHYKNCPNISSIFWLILAWISHRFLLDFLEHF